MGRKKQRIEIAYTLSLSKYQSPNPGRGVRDNIDAEDDIKKFITENVNSMFLFIVDNEDLRGRSWRGLFHLRQ